MRDITEVLSPAVLIGAATLTADNTPASIDRSGFDAVAILLSIGAGGITFDGTNKVEFKLTHSDDDSTYTAVASSDLIGQSHGTVPAASSNRSSWRMPRQTVEKFGYKGGKRYLQVCSPTSAARTALARRSPATWLLGNPLTAPVA
jgi:hypothetical protein